MYQWLKRFISISLFFLHTLASAQTVIPEMLEPWKEWVMKDAGEYVCPRPYNQAEQFFCTWQSEAILDLTDNGGNFTQRVNLYQPGWVMLVGDRDYWPKKATVSDKPLEVIERNGRPFVFLEPGSYEIKGIMDWSTLPERLAVPTTVGILQATINQTEIKSIDRDNQGYLWIQAFRQSAPVEIQADSVSLKVFKRLIDSIPQYNLTLLKVKITGQAREVLLGPVIESNEAVVYLKSLLPVRLESNGMLRLQGQPGTWEIYVNSRYLNQENHFKFISKDAPWPSEEIWSYVHQPQFRQVEITDAISIDASQTEMPQQWRRFPAYLVNKNSSLNLIEKQRGQVIEQGQSVELSRKMWLDFNGRGLTVEDTLTGVLGNTWRLTTLPPLILGRVSINGQDQLITQASDKEERGVEVRNRHLDLLGIGRIAGYRHALPAIGWNLDVNKLSTTLHLPPGWKLWHVTGVDQVSDSWLGNWNLLDIFMVLLISASIFKLLGLTWGLLALFTITITYQEPLAPHYTWLFVMGGLGILKVLPSGTARLWVKIITVVMMIVLTLLMVVFMGRQLQTAIYPQLNAYPQMDKLYISHDSVMSQQPIQTFRAAPLEMSKSRESIQTLKPTLDAVSKQMNAYDPNAKIQTGPGVPEWQWQTIQLDWQGPVSKTQTFHLWVMSAWLFSLFKFLGVGLMAFLLYGLIRLFHNMVKTDPQILLPKVTPHDTLSLCVALFLGTLFVNGFYSKESFAQAPNQELLKELKTYLQTPPGCQPHCADYGRLQIGIQDGILNLRLEVNVAESVAVPLPSHEQGWLVQDIFINGKKIEVANRDLAGNLWTYLEKGTHEINLKGRLVAPSSFGLNFSLQPKWVNILNLESSDWVVEGVNENRMNGTTITFTRKPNSNIQKPVTSQSQLNDLISIPPFVTYTRTFQLGLNWEVLNEIKRIAPQQGALSLNLPLMANEKILSSNVQVLDNHVRVQLGEHQSTLQWTSNLPITPEIELIASSDMNRKEIWRFKTAPMWHVSFEGIPHVATHSSAGQWVPEWMPWAKDTLTAYISKPTPAAGTTMSIDSSHYLLKPGRNKTVHELEMNIRSSQGGQHKIDLPNGIFLNELNINGARTPIHLIDNQLIFPVQPGEQRVSVKWESENTLSFRTKTPIISLNESSTNHRSEIDISKDRWILWLGGPDIGPAVQYWAVLSIAVLIALALSYSSFTPLKFWEWFLLSVGVTLSTPWVGLIIIGWFVAFQLRKQFVSKLSTNQFKVTQVLLIILTIVFVVSLLVCISTGLLGNINIQLITPKTTLFYPDMGHQNFYQLQWYQDQVLDKLPKSYVLSVPISVYRYLMLAWALWLVFSLLRWFGWGWRCFAEGALWNKKNKIK